MKKIQIDINKNLHDFFGFKKFKGNQEKAITSILEGHNTFIIMPTGGGKSLCYQLPSLILDGVAIIISPLIALMKNQVDSIRSYSKNHDIAHFFNSTLNKNEIQQVMNAVTSGKTKLLFVAPETISKEKNFAFFKSFQISFFAVDEAHCISEWGHDFRPDYRKLKNTIAKIGTKPIMALTATATEKVKKDIIKNLGIENNNLFISSFNRPNLNYKIQTKENIDKDIIKYIKLHEGKSGIIYCLSRKKAEEVSEILNLNNIKSLPYHAGLEQSVRRKTQDAFLMEDIDVVVATIAFGMGIDKPDVRFVIHYNLPKSLENYYQETGRAGRDGGEGNCILFYDPLDVEKFEAFNSKKNIYEKEISTQLLEEIVAYIESSDCRRKKLLHYFGEEYQDHHCKQKCNNCNIKKNLKNVQKELQLILETIQESSNKFNSQQITQILHGLSNNINNCKINNLKNFNKGEKIETFEIQQIIRKAIVGNLITKNTESYGTLLITEEGESFLKEPYEFRIMDKILNTNPSITSSHVSIDNNLIYILKKIRKKISELKNIPPFIIFQDPSLEDMSIQYPTTMEELRNIIGVGKGKAEKYGSEFIVAIRRYVDENNIERAQDFVVKSKPKKNDLKIFIIQSADRQLEFDDIIDQKNISSDILLDEIENIVNSGTKINIDYHINDILDDQQQEEIRDYFLNEAENDSISNAEKYFEGEYDEAELRLVRVKLFSDLAN
tara:strand:- start:2662 stop:4830 length:2169 start_codon:yes stop_codon:yes gene_type:complete